MSVVGFDFGNLFSYVAVARAGGIDVLLNDYSLHATPTYVGFGQRHRSLGVVARQGLSTNHKNTIINFKHLLGRKFDDPITQKYAQNIPAKITKGPNGEVLFDISYMGQQQLVSPEQVTAAFLTKLKEITEANIGTVHDVVISVPPFFTDHQREALIAAGQIAGLNVLKIVNENTAVALAYGIYKKGQLPAKEEKPKTVVFVDVGHSCVSASLVDFNERELRIRASTHDAEVGGMHFDNVIRDHFRQDFIERFKLDPKTNPRAWLRLLDEAEKLKKQMSANSTTIPFGVECFMNDIDVNGKMSRAEFEQLAEPLFQRVRNLLSSLLQQAGIQNVQDISDVEVIGGSSRIPFIKQIIAHIFNREPRTTLNADDVVARGAAMQCAILSPSVKVLEFNILNNQNYGVNVEYINSENKQITQTVIKKNDEFPGFKLLPLHKSSDFSISAAYENQAEIPHTEQSLGTWTIGGVTKPADADYRVVKVRLGVDNNGIFDIQKAMYEEKIEEIVEEPIEEAKPEEPKKETKEGEEPAPATEEPKVEEPTEKPKTRQVKKAKKVVHELPIQKTGGIIINVQQAIDFENQMRKNDLNEKLKNDAKNAVEEYVYGMRNLLSGRLSEFVTEEEVEKFNSVLTATEDWLYDEGEDTELAIYEKRLADMREVIEPPISKRQREKLDQEEVERNLREAEKQFQAEQQEANGDAPPQNQESMETS